MNKKIEEPENNIEPENTIEPEIKEKKKKPIKTVLFIIWIAIIAIVMILFAYIYPKLKNMNSLEDDTEELSPTEEIVFEDEEASTDLPTAAPITEDEDIEVEKKTNEDYGIINIAVFGMDNRYQKTIIGGRSDVNIILTIDTQNNEVRMTSIMRDTLIYIPAKDDYNRVNTAIVYEDGPEGAIAAIEEEFLIDIDHYVITSFRGMIEIIDALGGVEVTLSQQEVWDMNGLIEEMNLLFGHRSNKHFVQSRGTKTVNGIQAVAYMRIRKSDGVFMRDSRQKEVLLAAKNKLATLSFSDIDTMLTTVTNWVKTDLEPLEFIAMTKKLYDMRDCSYKTARVPYDGLYETVRYKSMAVIQYEKEETLQKMHDFIYEGIE